MPTARYRINSPTIALFFEGDRHVARTVPVGAVILVESLEGNELVEVLLDGKNVKMFAQDLRTRSERTGKVKRAPSVS